MNNATTGAALLSGYVLGRTKKGKLAIAMATWMLRKKINAKDITSAVAGSPAIDALGKQVREDLMTAGKQAAATAVAARADRLADTLHSRTADLREGLPLGKGGKAAEDAEDADSEDGGKENKGRDKDADKDGDKGRKKSRAKDRDDEGPEDEHEDEDESEGRDEGDGKDQDTGENQDTDEDAGGAAGEDRRPKPRKRSAKAGSDGPRRRSSDKEAGAAREKDTTGTARRSRA
ncbi:hypothetical protein ACFT5C_10010 [Streptomyces sp. NPDC057116]|uniref:hypothetical protein n=1 Tax=Streptomyces sp. NPDC057116 TaxID=3346023 RepID=UPI0036361F72